MNYPQSGDGWQQMPTHDMTPQHIPLPSYPGQAYPPGFYAPPPPAPVKKKRTWLWVLLTLVAVVVLAVGVGVVLVTAKSREQSRGVTVTYEVPHPPNSRYFSTSGRLPDAFDDPGVENWRPPSCLVHVD